MRFKPPRPKGTLPLQGVEDLRSGNRKQTNRLKYYIQLIPLLLRVGAAGGGV
jgi:hypothetical protein